MSQSAQKRESAWRRDGLDAHNLRILQRRKTLAIAWSMNIAPNHDPDAPTGLVAKAVARAKHGDESALQFLYVRFADDVYTYVDRIVRDAHHAHEITQHVFMGLPTALAEYDERRIAAFRVWLLRVSRGVAPDRVATRT